MSKHSEYVRFVMDLLSEQKAHQMPLKKAKEKLQSRISEKDAKSIAERAIEKALDEWIIEKVLDYDETDKESVGQLVWFLRIPSKERKEKLESLSMADCTFLKFLYESESHGRLGVIAADIASEKLRKAGVSSDYVPFIPGVTNDFFKNGEDDSVMYHYLIAENEKDSEFMV